jgi:hypothetical protein
MRVSKKARSILIRLAANLMIFALLIHLSNLLKHAGYVAVIAVVGAIVLAVILAFAQEHVWSNRNRAVSGE